MPEYKNAKVVRTKERILKKNTALMILAVLFAVLIYASGARNFVQGFGNAFLLWVIIKLYVVLCWIAAGWHILRLHGFRERKI